MLDMPFRDAVALHPLELLRRCGGYYEAPRDANGKLLGPLVGFTGRYIDAQEKPQQWVGDIYANWAMAEADNTALRALSFRMWQHIDHFCKSRDDISRKDVVLCGVPEGGRSFAAAASTFMLGASHLYPEKVVIAEATTTEREKTKLLFRRHQPKAGAKVFLIEDVSNNFSSTGQLIGEVQNHGARVAAIVTNLNRSPDVGEFFMFEGTKIPVLALVRKPMREYRQDDPRVAADIAAGNIAWSPKSDWARLMVAMEKCAA